MLNNCEPSRSLARAEEIRRAIAGVTVETTQGAISVTMSLGVLSSKDWGQRSVEGYPEHRPVSLQPESSFSR